VSELTLVGVACSVALWAAGVAAMRGLVRSATASAPPSWLARFGPEYEKAARSPLHHLVLSRATAYAAGFWLVVFALLEWGDVMLGVQLGAAAVYSVWATVSERRRQREDVTRLEADGLEPLQRSRALTWWYLGAEFAMLFGFTATLCFVVRALFEVTGA
jgi:hypothetical protein